MDKFFRNIIITLALGIIAIAGSLISAGWNANGAINDMGKKLRDEVKKEMMEVRRNDMEHIQNRFNTIEILMTGKIVSKQKNFEEEK